jgi:hypothetical protein
VAWRREPLVEPEYALGKSGRTFHL